MNRAVLPAVRFDRGLLIKRHMATFGQSTKDVHVLILIGLVGETQDPFWLWYRDGLTQWESRVRLGQPLRRKILQLLRSTCRYVDQLPSFMEIHDLRAQDKADTELGRKANEALELAFLERFKTDYLKEIPEHFIVLEVPFSEKDQAKALGAIWDPSLRKWKVLEEHYTQEFARWLPEQQKQNESADYSKASRPELSEQKNN